MSLKEKLQSLLPSPEVLKQDKRLRFLGDWLEDPNLFHINRRSIAGGVSIGFASAWCPLPIQMFLAVFLAVKLRKNLPVAAVATWITNPVTVPPMFYFAYWVGTKLLGIESMGLAGMNIELSLDWFFTQLGASWKPFFLGCIVMSGTFGLIGYFGMELMWRYHVLTKLKQRRKRMMNRLIHLGEHDHSTDKNQPDNKS